MLRWYRTKGRSFPWREQTDRYQVLVGEILLQRTRGEHVEQVFDEFVTRWPDGDHLGRARVQTIRRVIRPLGLTKRAPILKELGRALQQLDEVPSDPNELMKLPGVGPYASHAVPVFADGRDLPLVDWVIARVLRRYLGLPKRRRPNADRELWRIASTLARRGLAGRLWLGTLDFASAVCRPTPRCPECPLRSSCCYAAERPPVAR